MFREDAAPSRALHTVELTADLSIVGGGMAGVCCAITAARAGIKVVLAQDRPVLGGNASSEIRLWVLGATCHMGANNRWAREGGVIDEILVENMWRNPEGNSLIFDTIVLEKVTGEPNITLLLNTAVFEAEKSDAETIASVRGFCSQNSTMYVITAPLFCDASGDGVLGFLSGAAFRMGAESKEEFDEAFAPSGEFGQLLGHSLYFYSKDTGRPVKFTAPAFALKDITKIPRYKHFNAKEDGCRLWWIEWGGRFDTVHETENIKWELWKVVYGVWDYIKNSGKFPEAETLTLEWVGHIPGKRESRRFEGAYMLSQKDVVWRPDHEDAVAYGGWSIDLHPADGVYSELAGSHHLHSKGVYGIPYRCYYSRNIKNLFLAGRIMSSTHVAFGTTRVMATCAHGGQAIAIAAAICRERNCRPAEVPVEKLQLELLRTGQHIPFKRLADPEDLARHAEITASSRFQVSELPPDGPLWKLEPKAVGQWLPVAPGPMPEITLQADVTEDTELNVELRTTSRTDHHTPDVLLQEVKVFVKAGTARKVALKFNIDITEPRYILVGLRKNDHVALRCSEQRATGLLSVFHDWEERTSKVGGEDYEVWRPGRRPGGHNFAMRIEPPLDVWGPANVINGVQRPTDQPNAWLAATSDSASALTLSWTSPQRISRVELAFDTDADHAMESALYGHPERAMPFCVKHFRLRDENGAVLAEVADNHQTRASIRLDASVETSRLTVELLESHGASIPAALFEVRCY